MSAQPEIPNDIPPEPVDFGAEFANPAPAWTPFGTEQDVLDQQDWQKDADPQAGTAAGYGRADAEGRHPRHPDDPVRLLAWPYATPGTAALMVEQQLDTGLRHNWGTFPVDATHEQVLDRTRQPGTYIVTPITDYGDPVVTETQTHRFTIPAQHPFLVGLRGGPAGFGAPGAGYAGYAGYGTASASSPDPYLRHMESFEDRLARERLEMRQANAQRERDLRAAEFSLNQRHIDAAELAATRTALLTEQAVAKAQDLSEQTHKTTISLLTSGFEGVSKIQSDALAAERLRLEAAHNAERLRMDAAAAAAREERERKDKLDREERDRKDRLDREEKEDRRKREEEEKRERREREDRDRAAAREHQLELEKLRAAQNPMNMIAAVVGLIPTVTAGFKAMGIEPGELLQNAIGMGGAKGVTETIGDVITEGIRTFGKIARPDAAWDEVEEELDEEGRVLSSRVVRRGQAPPQAPPPQIPQAVVQPTVQPGSQPPPAPTGTAPGFAAPPPVTAPPPTNTAPPPGFAAPPPGAGFGGGAVPGMDSAAKARARKAIYNLVEQLTKTPQVQWPGVTAASMADPTSAADVGAYLRTYTIRVAAEEAGGKPELVQAFIDMLDGMNIAPDIPRG